MVIETNRKHCTVFDKWQRNVFLFLFFFFSQLGFDRLKPQQDLNVRHFSMTIFPRLKSLLPMPETERSDLGFGHSRGL